MIGLKKISILLLAGSISSVFASGITKQDKDFVKMAKEIKTLLKLKNESGNNKSFLKTKTINEAKNNLLFYQVETKGALEELKAKSHLAELSMADFSKEAISTTERELMNIQNEADRRLHNSMIIPTSGLFLKVGDKTKVFVSQNSVERNFEIYKNMSEIILDINILIDRLKLVKKGNFTNLGSEYKSVVMEKEVLKKKLYDSNFKAKPHSDEGEFCEIGSSCFGFPTLELDTNYVKLNFLQ